MVKETYIIDGIRTPIGSFCGTLSQVRTDDLLTHVLRGLAARNTNLDLSAIDDVIIGCANQAGEDNRNVA
ncbi:MAG TPA: 3-oxoadipyl-CoA thiolase, partial [Saprospiraceae bacterium]|nr:3-oxoadipyl-CoA thiolase [Saprospiraceae bacterium]